MLYACDIFARCLLDVCSMFAQSSKHLITHCSHQHYRPTDNRDHERSCNDTAGVNYTGRWSTIAIVC